MDSEIAKRFKILLDHLNLNPNQFANKLGYTRSTKIYNVLNSKNYPSFEILQDILKQFDNINIEWLLIGKGEMILSDSSQDNNIQKIDLLLQENQNLRDIISTLKEVIIELKK